MSPYQYIRSVLFLLLVPLVTFIACSLTLIDALLFRRPQNKVQFFPRTWGRVICKLVGVRVNIVGAENLTPDHTYIFVGNHVSQFDIFSFQGFFPHDFRWIAKKELFRIPLLGSAMNLAGAIPIDRSHGRKALKSLNQAAQQIAQGASVLIFPEGTRSSDGKLQPFKTGAITLAIKAGVPVVPIGFIGTHAILPKGKLLANSGEITIRIGRPLATNTFTMKDKQGLAKQLHAQVAELLLVS